MNHQMRRITENVFVKLAMPPTANPTDGIFPSSSTYIPVAEYERFAFLIEVGATDDTSITAQVVQATAAAGTGSKNITGAAITATLLAGTNDNKFAIIEIERAKLDIANDFTHVAITIAATGGSASAMAITFLGWRLRTYPPTFGSDKAEIVIVDG
jgi:hypothetical protein